MMKINTEIYLKKVIYEAIELYRDYYEVSVEEYDDQYLIIDLKCDDSIQKIVVGEFKNALIQLSGKYI